jgi:hypothetical protein
MQQELDDGVVKETWMSYIYLHDLPTNTLG